MSELFEVLKKRYTMNFVREDQLRRYVELNKITEEEFKEITGVNFSEV